MRRVSIAPLLLVAAALGSESRADVRLRPGLGGNAAQVTVRGSDAWSPRGHVDGAVLNSIGSLQGDGAPTVSVSLEGTLAVWSPASAPDTLAVALGMTTWRSLAPITDVKPGTSPQVATLVGGGWLVGWTRASSNEACIAVVRADGRRGPVWTVAVGDVQALAITGPSVTVFTLNATGQVIASGDMVPDQLPPIWRSTRVADRPVMLAPSTKTPMARNIYLPQDASMAFRAGRGTTLIDPAWQGAATSGTGTVALGGSLVATVQLSPEAALALWWHDAHTLQFVKLADGEVGEVQQVTGRAEFSPSLIREAIRAATSP